MNSLIQACEHDKITIENHDEDDIQKIVSKLNHADEYKYLNIKEKEFNGELSLQASYYIGYKWFDKDNYINISQKKYDFKQIDFLKIFMECFSHPIVSQKMNKSYKIFFDEPLIEIKDQKDEITPFLILHFLQIVKSIVKKGLKKGYVKVTQNLTSKIKGKILVNQTIKQNHFRNRIDKTVCNYQIFTINSLENQILKTALMQCGRYLAGIEDKNIIKILKQNITAFELINTKEVFDSDFRKIKHSPFYKEYKEALNLAKMIFKRFGFSLNQNNSSIRNKIPPYYIHMPELFERYVEVQLLNSGYEIIDGNNSGKIAQWSMRPDFLLPSHKMIIDAKYKFWFGAGRNGLDTENNEYKQDFMQLSLYGRDTIIRKKLGVEDADSDVELLFIYPKSSDKPKELKISDAIEFEKFYKIKKLAILVPYKDT